LFARHHGGSFVLRIEDTDAARSSDTMVRTILEGMEWLGLAPDEGPFFQSSNRQRHLSDARRLLDEGHAYRCFCGPEELRTAREMAEKNGGAWIYPRTCRTLSAAESRRRAEEGDPFVVRLRVPDGRIAWDDAVHGQTAFDGELLEDLIVVRSDGTPTYNLSVVSDDLGMGISHVIRGDDHISNTPKQIAIYMGLGQFPPVFAHIPLILGEDRKRLSKRHGAISVLEYRDRGYLAEAMFNFLALLGWNPGDEREKMTRDDLIEAFDLSGCGRSGALFDLAKLDWLNGQYLAELPPGEFSSRAWPWLRAAGLPVENAEPVVRLFQSRIRTFGELAEALRPYLDPSDDLEYEAAAVKKHLKGERLFESLSTLRSRFADLPEWTAGTLEERLRQTATELGLSAGKLIHPTRLAVTGRGASPGLFEVLEVLGRSRSLARLDRLLDRLTNRLV
jgi:glutamyl-tRNA synthetase